MIFLIENQKDKSVRTVVRYSKPLKQILFKVVRQQGSSTSKEADITWTFTPETRIVRTEANVNPKAYVDLGSWLQSRRTAIRGAFAQILEDVSGELDRHRKSMAPKIKLLRIGFLRDAQTAFDADVKRGRDILREMLTTNELYSATLLNAAEFT